MRVGLELMDSMELPPLVDVVPLAGVVVLAVVAAAATLPVPLAPLPLLVAESTTAAAP